MLEQDIATLDGQIRETKAQAKPLEQAANAAKNAYKVSKLVMLNVAGESTVICQLLLGGYVVR